jgi:PAS domain S-box-containing protein
MGPMKAARTGAGIGGGVRAVAGSEPAEGAETRADAPFGALARVAPVAIVQSDADGRAVFVNERWSELTGLPATRAVGSRWLDLVPPAERARIERAMTGPRPEPGQPEITFDTRLRTAAGAEVRVQGSVVALRRAGRPAGTLATFTEVPAAQRPPADPTTQFVATVSHELRTPLTSIISFLELIRAEDEVLSPDGVRFLDIIQRNANRLLRLVGDLLLLSRIESGISPPEMVAVPLPELVRDAVRNAAPAAAGYGVTLEADTRPGPELRGDPLGLTQVLDNLIANAVKFSHPGDTVLVRATWADGQWRIDVADQGIGIPPDEMDRLFQRFVRASNARTSGRPGTGLGLSVVKAIVELHGGRVSVESVLEQGTTFSIHLPAAPAGPASPAGPGRPEGRS